MFKPVREHFDPGGAVFSFKPRFSLPHKYYPIYPFYSYYVSGTFGRAENLFIIGLVTYRTNLTSCRGSATSVALSSSVKQCHFSGTAATSPRSFPTESPPSTVRSSSHCDTPGAAENAGSVEARA